jgi:hypothetical protein
MLKTAEALLEPDGRFISMLGGIDAYGNTRHMALRDLYDLVQPLELRPSVPPHIREQFDKARHAFIYSWFAYDLASLAEQQGYQVLELAIRHKLPPNEQSKAKHWGLKKLLHKAVAYGWLRRSDFETPPAHTQGERGCLLDLLPMFRNELAHGSQHLFPQGSLQMLHLCTDILNCLFSHAPPTFQAVQEQR